MATVTVYIAKIFMDKGKFFVVNACTNPNITRLNTMCTRMECFRISITCGTKTYRKNTGMHFGNIKRTQTESGKFQTLKKVPKSKRNNAIVLMCMSLPLAMVENKGEFPVTDGTRKNT